MLQGIALAANGKLSRAFNNVEDFAEIVNLHRRVENPLIHNLSGVEQLRYFFKSEPVTFAMGDFDFRHSSPSQKHDCYYFYYITGDTSGGGQVHIIARCRLEENKIVGYFPRGY
ncbi:hypothetical protein D3C77_684970 [compost metagenome]